MSAVVVEVRVHEGQEIKAGDPYVLFARLFSCRTKPRLTLAHPPSICVLSAMKMEQIVSAPVSGKVTRVCVAESDRYVSVSHLFPAELELTLVRLRLAVSLRAISSPSFRTPNEAGRGKETVWT